jgi:uridine kinase
MFTKFFDFEKFNYSVKNEYPYKKGLQVVSDIVLFIIKKLKKDIVIGIDGGSGSGKSKFAHELTKKIGEKNVLLIKLDNYCIGIKRLKKIDKNKFLNTQNWERPITRDLNIFSKDLTNLKLGKNVNLPKYSLSMGEREGSVLSLKNKVIIVEGIFALNENLINLYDISIFIDSKESDRFRRRLERDTFDNITDLYDYLKKTVSNMHQTYIKPNKKKAQIIIKN